MKKLLAALFGAVVVLALATPAVATPDPEGEALASYQRTRDCLSARLLAITDAIAAFSWDLDLIPTLLLELSDSMSDEVRLIRDLEPLRGMAPVR